MDTTFAPADADALCLRAAELIDSGRPGAARPLLAAARALSAADPGLTVVAARLAMLEGDWSQAVAELDAGILATPSHAGLRLARAEVRHRIGDIEGAARDAAEAVIFDPDDPRGKALLGATLLDLGRLDDAVACLREAVAIDPGATVYREVLATAQERTGDTDAALRTLNEAIAQAPAALSPRNAAILISVRRRDFVGAVRLAEQARVAGIADATTFGMKGHALASLGRHREASLAYQDALKLAPEDGHVRHLVAASAALSDADRAPERFIRTVFDGYAERFEGHLLALNYGIPGVIRSVLEKHPKLAAGLPIGPVLDLGCGTGLCAMAIGDLDAGPFTGVDLSPRMLDQARVKRLYVELREGEIVAELAKRPEERWPLIVAADVVCYFGALEALFAAVHASLGPQGWFVFSVEEILADHDGVMPGNGNWALGRQGRYAHSPQYVHETAFEAGFRVLRIDRPPIRQEAGIDVPGLLLTLERMAAS
jgi:tetratricopeptide (TPR) repeat protein